MRALAYTRFSSDLQNPTSCADQEREIRARVTKERWDLVRVLSDHAISGSSPYRPGYQELLKAVRQRECDVVVAEALDRLSHDQEDLAHPFKRCQHASIPIITLT